MMDSVNLLNQIQACLERGEYQEVRLLLKRWQQLEPRNPWFHLYVARWYEATEKWERAEEGYRKLLKTSNIMKVVTQSRQGLDRLAQRVRDLERQAIAAAKATPDGEEYGLLVIEPIAAELKKEAAQYFAEVMKTDVYSARMQLPSRSWRLFRTGKLGELRFYANALAQGNIAGFCLGLAQITGVQVLQVKYISELEPQLVIHCTDSEQHEQILRLDWAEISRRVEGMIPLFEESLEKDSRGKVYYKTKILDYAQFCDLHLGDRQIILRLNDQQYQFQQGLPFFVETNSKNKIEQHSVRRNWNNLQQQLAKHLGHAQTWTDFKAFAGDARDFPELLRKITPQVNLFRLEEHRDTHWDPAWQLYSAVIFAKAAQDQVMSQALKN